MHTMKLNKNLIGSTLLFATYILVGFVLAKPTMAPPLKVANAETAPASAPCPDGSYQIGWDRYDDTKPVCKNVPTGCPYGDSIPLDDPHCAPPANPDVAYARWYPEGQAPTATTPTAPASECK